MAISVYVMPLETNLRGNFRPTWMTGSEGCAPRNRRPESDVRDGLDAFGKRLEGLLGFRPEWDDAGPVRSATVFSVDGFSLPFLQARRWSYRLKLPRLCALEIPQIWIPADFDPVFHFPAPWHPESELGVASTKGMEGDLKRLQEAMAADPAMEESAERAETVLVAGRLREIAALGIEHGLPVIVEG